MQEMPQEAARFYAAKVLRRMERSRHSYITILKAPARFGKRTFAQDCVAAMGRKRLTLEVQSQESRESWERFVQLLCGEETPREVAEAEPFAPSAAVLRLLTERMRAAAREWRAQGVSGLALIVGHIERLRDERFFALLKALALSPVPGWRFYFLYEEKTDAVWDETAGEALEGCAALPGTLVVDAEALRLHAENVYDYFLQNHIPVTAEAIVSLQRHSDGAVGEVADVLRLQLRAESSVAKLTRREQEIASMASSGLTNQEIAARLYISENTVKSALKSIFFKLHIHSRRKLIGLIHPETKVQ